jgi:hypothetical protein
MLAYKEVATETLKHDEKTLHFDYWWQNTYQNKMSSYKSIRDEQTKLPYILSPKTLGQVIVLISGKFL